MLGGTWGLARRYADLERMLGREYGHLARAAEILVHRDLQASRAVQHLGAQGARQRRLLLRQLELDPRCVNLL